MTFGGGRVSVAPSDSLTSVHTHRLSVLKKMEKEKKKREVELEKWLGVK